MYLGRSRSWEKDVVARSILSVRPSVYRASQQAEMQRSEMPRVQQQQEKESGDTATCGRCTLLTDLACLLARFVAGWLDLFAVACLPQGWPN